MPQIYVNTFTVYSSQQQDTFCPFYTGMLDLKHADISMLS